MCDFSGKLVAWIDRELPDDEARAVELHLEACPECRVCLEACRAASRAFNGYCEAIVVAATRSKRSLWAPVLGLAAASAAVLLVWFFWSAKAEMEPIGPIAVAGPQTRTLAPAVVSGKKIVPRRRFSAGLKPKNVVPAQATPMIQIAIPAEEVFPPGAIPQGVSFVAELSLGTGDSVQNPGSRP